MDSSSITIETIYRELCSFRESVEGSLAEVKTAVLRLEGDVSRMKKDMAYLQEREQVMTEDIKETSVQLEEMREKIDRLEQKAEDAERYSRRENLIFYGLEESPHEDCTALLIDVLKKEVPVRDWCRRDFMRVHRLGKRRNKDRPVIARFQHHSDKMAVLERRDALRSSGVGVSGDLTAAQRQQLHELREDGKRGYFKAGKLVTEDAPAPRGKGSSSSHPPRSPASDHVSPTTSPSSQRDQRSYSDVASAPAATSTPASSTKPAAASPPHSRRKKQAMPVTRSQSHSSSRSEPAKQSTTRGQRRPTTTH